MDTKPAVIPHDEDEEVKNSDLNPNETKNPPPQVTKTIRQPDGTEVQEPVNK